MNMNPLKLSLTISLLLTSYVSLANSLPDDYNAVDDNITLNSTALTANHLALIDNSQLLHINEATQQPTFLWAKENSVNAKTAIKNPTHADIEQHARQHLARYANLYQLNTAAQTSAKLENIQKLKNNSGYLVRFKQTIAGLDVFNKRMSLLLNDNLQVSALSGNLAPQVSYAKTALKNDALQAISVAFNDLHQEKLSVKQLQLHKKDSVYSWFNLSPTAQVTHRLHKPVRIKSVLYALNNRLIPAHYLELSTESSTQRASYAYVISANDGKVLVRHNLIRNESAVPFTYRVWADSQTLMPYDSPYGNLLTPLLTSKVTKPVKPVSSNLISLSCGLMSRCDPWLANNATETNGNNVKAYTDMNKPNGFSKGDIMGKVSSANSFDYGYNFTLFDNAKHKSQLQAALTQAFYTTNFLHDWLYDHGFNEASGNGQLNNYGRGGLGNDAMHVEINDYDGVDNANMDTPSDGETPIMQMFMWTHDGKKSLQVKFNAKTHTYSATTADFGLQNFNLSGKKIVLVDDGNAINSEGGTGSKADGCQTPFVNASALIGAVALMDRGDCFFDEKVKHAQDAGAIAVIIANNRSTAMIPIGGNDALLNKSIKIPTFGIEQRDGAIIKRALKNTSVTASLLRKIYPPFNGALDNTIVTHEWAHFLTQRLVWLNNQQGNSMGEGWSDFLALIMLVQESDKNIAGNEQFQAPYAIAQYADSNELYTYPLGIRRYPYSTDLSKNPLTFKHISNNVALPTNVIASSYADLTGSDNAEVHNSGEVWASLLWEVYVALLNDSARLSFSDAQNRMLDYLVASLKLTPSDPTFLEARDALLAVAKARDLEDYQLFWKAFAKRGAGVNAKAPKRYLKTQIGVIEDFTAP